MIEMFGMKTKKKAVQHLPKVRASCTKCSKVEPGIMG